MLSVVSDEFDPKCHFLEVFGTFQLRVSGKITEKVGGDVVLLLNFLLVLSIKN